MRLPLLQHEAMSPRQREVYEAIAGKRGHVRGPYGVWLHSPELCDRVASLSNYLRFDSPLPERIKEFAILVTARFWDAQYSWNAHVDKAIAAGIAPEVVKSLAAGQKPAFTREDESAFYDFATEALQNHFVSDATFERIRGAFGDEGAVEVIGCVGYFSMLQICLNTAQVTLQADREPPFPDVRGYRRLSAAERS